MKLPATTFWTWFRGFASRLPDGPLPEHMLELSTNAPDKELILTAQGDLTVFPEVEAMIDAAPDLDGWTFIALKPALGFHFTHRDNGIALNAAELWFLPLKSKSDPHALAVCLGVPDAEVVFDRQTVDTAFTILETGIGERSCATDIQHVTVDDLPDDPPAHGYIPLLKLADYIEWHKAKTGPNNL